MVGWARRLLLISAGLLIGSGGLPGATAREPARLQLEVDARDLPRRLLHSRIEVTCRPGKLALWFPKWVPGTHAPCGPVENIAGFRLEAPEGKPLPWRRDDLELYRVECAVPEGVRSLIVRLDTLCNEPAVRASGYLSYGNDSVGILNWSTCLVYPEGPSCDDIRVNASLRLPAAWQFATALAAESAAGGRARFRAVSLTELVECPVIAGEHLRTIPLDAGSGPPACLHVASESPAALRLGPDVVALYSRLVKQAGALFGGHPYPAFHFLVTCSDDLGYFGLEHLTSSLNGVRERDLLEPALRRGWVANLLPHEYVHAWCGKFRRPAGMCTPDFHPRRPGCSGSTRAWRSISANC
jgi:predicted metalloprotease with PDZ domain